MTYDFTSGKIVVVPILNIASRLFGGSKDEGPKVAAAFLRKGNVYLHRYAVTTQGLSVFCEPVVALEEGDDRLASELLSLLWAPTRRIAHPKRHEWSKVIEPLLKAAKVRSWAAFARVAKHVQITLSAQEVSFAPMKIDDRQKSFLPLGEEKTIRCQATVGEVTVALRLAFERCE